VVPAPLCSREGFAVRFPKELRTVAGGTFLSTRMAYSWRAPEFNPLGTAKGGPFEVRPCLPPGGVPGFQASPHVLQVNFSTKIPCKCGFLVRCPHPLPGDAEFGYSFFTGFRGSPAAVDCGFGGYQLAAMCIVSFHSLRISPGNRQRRLPSCDRPRPASENEFSALSKPSFGFLIGRA
jgi:hypothetical protein